MNKNYTLQRILFSLLALLLSIFTFAQAAASPIGIISVTQSNFIHITDSLDQSTKFYNKNLSSTSSVNFTVDQNEGAVDSTSTAVSSPGYLNGKFFVEFDGQNDYARGKQLLSNLAEATVMGWIRLESPFTNNGFILGQDNFNLSVNAADRKLSASANGTSVVSNTTLSSNVWYHITAVYKGSDSNKKLTLYINGLEDNACDSAMLDEALQPSTSEFSMASSPSGSEFFKGAIDEVRVFSVALSENQIQKMVYQEIKSNGTGIQGEVIPKDIEQLTWASLLAYYRFDTFYNDGTDEYKTATIDLASDDQAFIYNINSIRNQLAPMPFTTSQEGLLEESVSRSNSVRGSDVMKYPWSILRIQHPLTLSSNMSNLGLIIAPGIHVIVDNDNAIKNTWYLKIDGTIDLQGRSQLVQYKDSDLDPTSSGSIERDQQGTVNKFNYNYWASPVGAINSDENNSTFTLGQVLFDGTNPDSPQPITWTSGLNSAATAPITLSNYWIFKFQNVNNTFANWSSVGNTGAISAAVGFTLKGSNADTAVQNYTFIGKPNSGMISLSIPGGNMNLCGNPYPSALDANAFIKDNLSSTNGTLYFWEHFSTNTSHNLADYQGGYATRTLVGGTPPVSPSMVSGLGSSTRIPQRFIPVGQGFFVTGSNSGGTIKFDNSQRAFVKESNSQSNNMFRMSESSLPLIENSESINSEDPYEEDSFAKIRLGFNSHNQYHRQILLGFMNENATSAYDLGYDAIHIDTQPNDMSFLKGNSKFNILGEGIFNENDIFPLSIKTDATGTVQFVVDFMEHFADNQRVFIYDNATGQYHNIKENTFEVTLDPGTINDRFSLRFTDGTALGNHESIIQSGIFSVYNNDNETIDIVNPTGNPIESANLYTVLGQAVGTFVTKDSNQKNIHLPARTLNTGTYIIKMHTAKGDLSNKIIIR